MENLLDKANAYVQENASKIPQIFRPNSHLAAETGWMNDPNGFVFYKNEYHLFYQTNPYGDEWDTMHWGHAKSKDLVHWQYLPMALAPDRPYDERGCFSGSSIIKDNKIYLMYTGVSEHDGIVRQVQCLAISNDGVHFEKYEQNPVIAETNLPEGFDTVDFRDPKLIKHDNTYYAVLATKKQEGDRSHGAILIFSSIDLINWSQGKVLVEGSSDMGIIWECPDLIQDHDQVALIVSPMQMPSEGLAYKNINSSIYMTGKMNWDDLTFSIDDYHEIDAGLDFYAPQTCLNDKNEVIMTAWMQTWGRTNVQHELNLRWSGQMILPRKIVLSKHGLKQEIPSEVLEEANDNSEVITSRKEDSYLLESNNLISLKKENKKPLEISFGDDENHNLRVSIDQNRITLSRKDFGYRIHGEEKETIEERTLEVRDASALKILIDRSSIEVFIDGKTLSATYYVYPELKKCYVKNPTKSEFRIKLSQL
ncbi:glycoside hydrolase family 32 protein [Lactobacillus gigeriorum]|uniref:beta-fructofuranosidase n=1 Tax=Lactobacillus gigeriorum DSM 23908 = CRBIP 24.85 TaxID=1423751 RepID=I7J3K8_9LACO|nr:glycoside hydrolase family 32 protein [Lactobacillus gigeriorum]KRN08885.1 beta-fructofuranosidase [Lactobacillus gigeriorum DSM 23908 = CRBIP 24.85]CCI87727.1 Sucrose-6-phosphate hydrolase [Lactobacillus gigeriorum DSM 23908 = CRBIP 24.85]